MSDTKVIMYDSEEAAKYKEIELKGWVSSDGFYFGKMNILQDIEDVHTLSVSAEHL